MAFVAGWRRSEDSWCCWDRRGNHWVQWELVGPWIDDMEYDTLPRFYGPRSQFWMSLGEVTIFWQDCELFLVFGVMGVRLVYWLGGNVSMEFFGSDLVFFNTDWGYVHYVPLRDSVGGSPDVLGSA